MSDTYQFEGREIFEKRQTENRKNKADTENNPYEQDQPAFLYQGESFLRTALLNRIDHPAWLRNYNPEHLAQYGDHYGKLHEGFNRFLWENSQSEPYCFCHEYE